LCEIVPKIAFDVGGVFSEYGTDFERIVYNMHPFFEFRKELGERMLIGLIYSASFLICGILSIAHF
jgi:hypothetical protein